MRIGKGEDGAAGRERREPTAGSLGSGRLTVSGRGRGRQRRLSGGRLGRRGREWQKERFLVPARGVVRSLGYIQVEASAHWKWGSTA